MDVKTSCIPSAQQPDDCANSPPPLQAVVSSEVYHENGLHSQATVMLKGHCHHNFVIFSSKQLKYLTKNPFSKMKLLLERLEENIKGFIRGRTNYNQFLVTSLQYTGGA